MANSYHLSDVFKLHLPLYQQRYKLTSRQATVCQHIQSCRTQALGEQQWRCDECHYEQRIFCSCGDRHCPRCQGKQTQEWIEKQEAEVLNCRYFHLVFTLPHELNILAHYKAKALYSALFEAVWQTLSQFGISRKQLQGQLGGTAVLHTWGQNLSQHIHLHCLIPGGVLTQQGEWRGVKSDYLFPVKALATVYRAKMLQALRARELDVPDPEALMSKSWCVYSKACLSHAATVVKYLGRYTRKGMLQESRIKRVTADSVSFSYTDYADSNKRKVMQLEGEEFVRRYLLHVLPKGVMRVRHFGFLANACKRNKLEQIKVQLPSAQMQREKASVTKTDAKQSGMWLCPKCQQGYLQFIRIIEPQLLILAPMEGVPFRLTN
ncbi:IS91 family transposase [Shewanella gelidimarina]|uniref:IS91 family transposase n=1 Tax=Shewanella gelidimarina TaxID=56813 RepID=UPI00200CED92|nr:IS91 family transposase [Shewanella gelidimarina]MCL1058846.1 IS91 family transposase [Shewanella gelidimarina]